MASKNKTNKTNKVKGKSQPPKPVAKPVKNPPPPKPGMFDATLPEGTVPKIVTVQHPNNGRRFLFIKCIEEVLVVDLEVTKPFGIYAPVKAKAFTPEDAKKVWLTLTVGFGYREV